MAKAKMSTPLLKQYVTTEKLGAGSYGEVFKAHGRSGSRRAAAVKCISRPRLSKAEQDNLITEIKLLKTMKHRYIVEMIDFEWDANYIYIITEYCAGGDLSRMIKAHKSLGEGVCKHFLQQLSQALQFLRSKNIAHMDLKPSNILLTSKNPNTCVLKLADFGFAQTLRQDQTKQEVRGSLLYMAPEMVLKRKYDAKVDLWSVGVILYECLFGQAPYKSATIEELLAKVREDKPVIIPRSKHLSKECFDLLSKCLLREPEERITFDDFFSHPFLDLKHLPATDSYSKGMDLIDRAVMKDKQNDLKSALALYKKGLAYLVPLIQSERDATRKEDLRKCVVNYIKRAEELKNKMDEGNSKPKTVEPETEPPVHEKVSQLTMVTRNRSRPSSAPSTLSRMTRAVNIADRTSFEHDKFDELIKLCAGTPRLRTGLQIAQSAEGYERDSKYPAALEKYELALGVLIPLMKSEPPGERKVKLGYEVTRWLNRAEVIKEILTIQEKVLAEQMGEDRDPEKSCGIQ